MTARPDASALRAFLARASRRVAWMSAAEGAAAGLAIALVLSLAGWPARGALASAILTGLTFAALGVALAIALTTRRRGQIALLVERRAPQCRNLVVTADELGARPAVAEHIATLVYSRAARLVNGLDLGALFPARNAVVALALSTALWSMAIARGTSANIARASRMSASSANAATIDGVDVIVTPPSYAARPTETLRDPARVDALAGSRIQVTVRAHAARMAMETLRGRDSLRVASPGVFTGELLADADGYVALEPRAGDGHAGARRLIGLSVIPDAAPRVRITAPGRDLFLPNTRQSIDLAVEARDDIALASIRLRYTKVSGSGERFTFTEGEVPLQLARGDARAWTARATWHLEGLGLGPGDMVVYRAVAADHRPGATPAESDSYIAEILSPGGDAAAGFAVDPEQERYAVSQQMVILKTERLAARRASMSADAYLAAAQDLGAEQRKVRAEFVFMMGGEVADAPDPENMTDINEEAEAAGEDELLAGRAANQGRVALLRAIRYMSRASAALTTAELTPALTHERAALAQLERAFARTRIILRALTERERLDLSRRLSGVLTDAARSTRPMVEPAPDPRVIALRQALSGVATLSGSAGFVADAPARASVLAEGLLRVDPSSKPLQDVAALLASAASAIGRGRDSDARALIDRAATGIVAVLRSDLPTAPLVAPTIDLDRLGGALTDALRRRARGTP